MHIYLSGLGGVGIGPLAEIALDAGYQVSGSDLAAGPMTKQLTARGVTVGIGQDGSHIKDVHAAQPIDWFVHTAALPDDHAELAFAREAGIRCSKRDELLARIIDDTNLRLLAVAGTHGKTTTSAMLVWLFSELGIPLSYSVGATLSFGPSGKFDPNSRYFVYECDEYDRNFLHFSPWASLITSVDYDHPNVFPTVADYTQAFREFLSQSKHIYLWQRDAAYLGGETPLAAALEAVKPGPRRLIEVPDSTDVTAIALAGEHTRRNAYLATRLVLDGFGDDAAGMERRVIEALNRFPGTDRRFETLADNLITDYGHHPVEIAATLQMAKELNEHVVLVYQPHQNVRQHHVKDDYRDALRLADKIYWLPTYLSREDPSLPVLTPDELIATLANRDKAQAADMDTTLWEAMTKARAEGKLVLAMGAGSIDAWVRQRLEAEKTASTAQIASPAS